MNKIQDERLVALSNSIYKKSFYILWWIFLLDFLLKFNMFGVYYSLTPTISLFMWIEAAALVTVFYISFFSLAKNGIAVGINDSESSKLPKKTYLALSAAFGVAISFCMWTLRWITFDWRISEIRGFAAVILIASIHIITFILAFFAAFISLAISYKMAIKAISS